MSMIIDVYGREVLDSRGNPTVEVEVLLEDEDGYVWTCPFGENSWAIGDEYQLVIKGEHIEIKTYEEE